MARAVLDLSIQAGYPYEITLDMEDYNGNDLEADYSCYFYCESIGTLTFSANATNDAWELEISEANTDLLLTNLEDYVVYTIKTSDSKKTKLLEGRIHVDAKVRG